MGVCNMFIVGGKFAEFAKHNNVMTVSEFDKFIDGCHNIASNIRCLIGQGVQHDFFDSLKSKVKERNLCRSINFENDHLLASREEKHIVHKQKTENVMITKPLPCQERNVYKSALILDERCAEMSDHVTGQHLQGMILTEAARQMMTAVCERHLLDEDERKDASFTLNKLSPEFKSFAFPLEVDIYYKVVQMTKIPKKCLKSNAQITFVQGGRTICEVEVCFSVFSKKFVQEMEQRAALELVTYSQSRN